MGEYKSMLKHPETSGALPRVNITDQVNEYVTKCYNEVTILLEENLDDLKKIVKILYKKTRMSKRDFKNLFPDLEEKTSTKFEEFIGD